MEATSLPYVTDSNIWIDLDKGNLIEKAFELPFDLIAPDVIIAELHDPDGDVLVDLGLQKRDYLDGRF